MPKGKKTLQYVSIDRAQRESNYGTEGLLVTLRDTNLEFSTGHYSLTIEPNGILDEMSQIIDPFLQQLPLSPEELAQFYTNNYIYTNKCPDYRAYINDEVGNNPDLYINDLLKYSFTQYLLSTRLNDDTKEAYRERISRETNFLQGITKAYLALRHMLFIDQSSAQLFVNEKMNGFRKYLWQAIKNGLTESPKNIARAEFKKVTSGVDSIIFGIESFPHVYESAYGAADNISFIPVKRIADMQMGVDLIARVDYVDYKVAILLGFGTGNNQFGIIWDPYTTEFPRFEGNSNDLLKVLRLDDSLRTYSQGYPHADIMACVIHRKRGT